MWPELRSHALEELATEQSGGRCASRQGKAEGSAARERRAERWRRPRELPRAAAVRGDSGRPAPAPRRTAQRRVDRQLDLLLPWHLQIAALRRLPARCPVTGTRRCHRDGCRHYRGRG